LKHVAIKQTVFATVNSCVHCLNLGTYLPTTVECLPLTLRRRIKSHLLFAGIIRSSPFSPR